MMNKAQEKGVPAEKVIFFPNWSEVARFRDVTEQDAQALRAQLGLPEDQKSFFTQAISAKSRGWRA